MESRGWSNYVVFSFQDEVQTDRLVQAAHKVVSHNPILRTAFVPYQSDIVQIVRTRPSIEFEHINRDLQSAIEEHAHSWIEFDKRRESLLSAGTLRLLSIGQSSQATSKMVMTLSHARFDALSLSHICSDLAAAYDEKPLPPRPGFAQFVQRVIRNDQDSAENFWRKLLHRSEMTEVVRRPDGHAYQYPVFKTHSQWIKSPEDQSFTFATVLKAAWALVLAQHANTPDVVFGHLVSGRAGTMDGIDDVVGPCINLVPVRIRLSRTSTASELLSSVQDQYIAAIPHETLGFNRVIQECTNWPRRTRFSSVVQHQNIEEVTSVPFEHGKTNAEVQLSCPDHDSADLWIISIPKSDKIEVTLNCNDGLVPEDLAKELLKHLCSNIEILLQSGADDAEKLPRPWSRGGKSLMPTSMPASTLPKNSSSTNDTTQHSEEQRLEVQNLVRGAWRNVLEVGEGSTSQEVGPNSVYYDIRGDIAATLLLKRLYEKVGHVELKMEEIIDHPTQEAQVDLILSKGILAKDMGAIC